MGYSALPVPLSKQTQWGVGDGQSPTAASGCLDPDGSRREPGGDMDRGVARRLALARRPVPPLFAAGRGERRATFRTPSLQRARREEWGQRWSLGRTDVATVSC